MAPKNLLTRNLVIFKKYRIIRKIGEGSFGEVYEGIDLDTKKSVAIKVESLKTKHAFLSKEREIYNFLKGGTGIPTVKYFGKDKECTVLVMDLLGPSLEDLLERCSNHFSLKTILMIADQLLERINYIHSKTFLHLDIKPANLLVGIDGNDPLIYIIDMGISKNYMDSRKNKHIPFKVHEFLYGTSEYSSINTDYGEEQSRRDDMEALGYLFVYFWKGKLPWEGLKARNSSQLCEKIVEKKVGTPLKELCKGMPDEFLVYIKYCRSLEFTDEPDYKNLRGLFRELFFNKGCKNDQVYDWDILSS